MTRISLLRLSIPFLATAFLAGAAGADPLPQSRKGQSSAPASAKRNPCAHYGAGFVQAAGSTTCVKIGGKVEFELGVRPGRDTFRTR